MYLVIPTINLLISNKLDFFCRSSSTPRSKPSQEISQHKLSCVICWKRQHNKITEKFRICELERAKFLLQAATLFQDEVFTRISDLSDESSIIAADLYCHKSCISGYKVKFNINMDEKLVSKQPKKRDVFSKYITFIKAIFENGKGISLSELRDMLN